MATIDVQGWGSGLGNALSTMLTAPDIIPGDQPSYELCKTIWLYHPLGAKLAETPIAMAMSQQREVTVQDGPEDVLKRRFTEQWAADKWDDHIYNTAATSRAYGIATMAMQCKQVPPDRPVDPRKLADYDLAYPTFDPLNTAGSLVLNQDPNAFDFQRVVSIAVSGVPYHPSRTVTIMNERPVYIAYTTSAYGFVGRSVYQRCLYPLKSFVQTMVTDDMVSKKAGLLVAAMKTGGSIVDNVMRAVSSVKRNLLKEALVGNILQVGHEDKIETLNMQNLDGAYGMARKNILENIAAASDGAPAQLLNAETFAEGFGEGTEDAKHFVRYIDRKRREMEPLYAFAERINARRAWDQEFYATLQRRYPEWRRVPYETAFVRFYNGLSTSWPSLLTEPDSEKVKTDDVKLKAIIAAIQVLAPLLDPGNKGKLVQWATDNINANERMFTTPLVIDLDELEAFISKQAETQDQQMEQAQEGAAKPPKPFSAADSVEVDAAVRTLEDMANVKVLPRRGQ